MRSVLFCNEALGLGHLRISTVLAGALVSNFRGGTALVVTGSYGHRTVPLPQGVDLVKLPSVPADAAVEWTGPFRQPAELSLKAEDVFELRAQLSSTIVRTLVPDVVLVDHTPLGQSGDLLPTLEWLRANTAATVALGLRDFDDAAAMREIWDRKLVEAIRGLYDLVILYGEGEAGDPRLEALHQAGVPVHRTGLIGAAPAGERPRDLPSGYLLVTVGGGVDGFALLDCVLRAREQGLFAAPTLLVTGPMMTGREVAQLRRRSDGLPVRVERERADMGAVLSGATAVVAMAGYATVAEILASGKPALLVPRVFPRTEQLHRASHWAAAGRMRMLDPRQLNPERLGHELSELVEESPYSRYELTGAAQVADILALALRT